jgi:hypothetical protein
MKTAQSGVGIPHGMINHQMQANSKKSFRIRGREEQELLKQQMSLANSTKDLKEFNNGKFYFMFMTIIFYRHFEICV